jgi:5-methylcytosine-specific restriction endonuclease McrA
MGSQTEMKEDHSSRLMQKSCSACRKVLPLTQFHRHKSSKDGKQSRCRDCNAASAILWNSTNKEKRKVIVERFHKTDHGRESLRRSRQKRRAIKLSLPHVAYDPQAVYEREAGICHLCGVEVDRDTFHVEHLIPIQVDLALLEAYGILSHPGDVPWNVSIAHPSCNSSKGNRMTQGDVDKYFQQLQMYGR